MNTINEFSKSISDSIPSGLDSGGLYIGDRKDTKLIYAIVNDMNYYHNDTIVSSNNTLYRIQDVEDAAAILESVIIPKKEYSFIDNKESEELFNSVSNTLYNMICENYIMKLYFDECLPYGKTMDGRILSRNEFKEEYDSLYNDEDLIFVPGIH